VTPEQCDGGHNALQPLPKRRDRAFEFALDHCTSPKLAAPEISEFGFVDFGVTDDASYPQLERPSLMPDKGWQRRFDQPIPLPKGKKLVTLRDAAEYITELPKAEHDAEEWLAAMKALLLVAEHDGPTMFALPVSA
jgi:hypothetical protein